MATVSYVATARTSGLAVFTFLIMPPKSVVPLG